MKNLEKNNVKLKMDSQTIIKNRILKLNQILDTQFTLDTWPDSKGLPHIHLSDAWEKIIQSLTNIVNLDSNNKKKLRQTNEFRKSRELGGEIIVMNKFINLNPKFEVKQNDRKDVDVFIELISGEKISVEISTLNYLPEDEDRIELNKKKQLEDGKFRMTVYEDISYKRIKTAVIAKTNKFINQKDQFNFILLYNVTNADVQDLAEGMIGKFGFQMNLNTQDLSEPILTSKGIWSKHESKLNNVHGVGLFNWSLRNLFIIYKPKINIPDQIKKVFSDFKEVNEMREI